MEILNFSDADFADMRIPAHKVSDTTNIVRKYNLLRIHSQFGVTVPGINKTQLIKWIIFCFDPMSPFVASVSDEYDRRIQSAIEAGFEDSTKYSKEFTKALNMKDPVVNMMIMKYCEICRPSVYTTIVALRQSLLLDLKALIESDLNAGEKKSLLSNIESTERMIYDKERVLFSGTTDDGLKEALLNYSDSASAGTTPEVYAKILRGDNIPEDIFKEVKRDYSSVKRSKGNRVLELDSDELDLTPIVNIR